MDYEMNSDMDFPKQKSDRKHDRGKEEPMVHFNDHLCCLKHFREIRKDNDAAANPDLAEFLKRVTANDVYRGGLQHWRGDKKNINLIFSLLKDTRKNPQTYWFLPIERVIDFLGLLEEEEAVK